MQPNDADLGEMKSKLAGIKALYPWLYESA
jgi:hypothetical protein